MISIPHDRLVKKSFQTGVSIFALTRCFMMYRKANENDRVLKKCCGYCKASCMVKFIGVERFQCNIIGIGNDYYADIKPCFTCDFNRVSHYKINEQGDKQ